MFFYFQLRLAEAERLKKYFLLQREYRDTAKFSHLCGGEYPIAFS